MVEAATPRIALGEFQGSHISRAVGIDASGRVASTVNTMCRYKDRPIYCSRLVSGFAILLLMIAVRIHYNCSTTRLDCAGQAQSVQTSLAIQRPTLESCKTSIE